MAATVTAEIRFRPDLQPNAPYMLGLFGLPGVLGDGIKWVTGWPDKASANAFLTAATFKNIIQTNQPKEDPPWLISVGGLGIAGGDKPIMRFASQAAANAYIAGLSWGGKVLLP